MPIAKLITPAASLIGLSFVANFPDAGPANISQFGNDDYYFGYLAGSPDTAGSLYALSVNPPSVTRYIASQDVIEFWSYGSSGPTLGDDAISEFSQGGIQLTYPATDYVLTPQVNDPSVGFASGFIYALSDAGDNANLATELVAMASGDVSEFNITLGGFVLRTGVGTYTDQWGTWPAFNALYISVDWSYYYRLTFTPQVIDPATGARDIRALSVMQLLNDGYSSPIFGRSGWWVGVGGAYGNNPNGVMLGGSFGIIGVKAGAIPGVANSGFTALGVGGAPAPQNPYIPALINAATTPRQMSLGGPRYTFGPICMACYPTAAGTR